VFCFLSDDDGGDVKLSLFADLVCMEVQAGYKERGVALIQALIEFNNVRGAKLTDFAVFWRLGVARIGDSNYDGGFEAWMKGNGGRSLVTRRDPDLLSFVSGAKWCTPSEWPAKESDECCPAVDDPEANIVEEDVTPFIFSVRSLERVRLFALGACGVNIRPSFVCDDPGLSKFDWADFYLLNGEYLHVGKDFATNICVASMKLNPALFGVLGIRSALLLEDQFSGMASFLSKGGVNSALLTCEVLLTCENGKEEGHVVLWDEMKKSEDPMIMASCVMTELNLLSRAFVSTISVEQATLLFRKAVDDGAPRGILFATTVLGAVLASLGKLRESIVLFESVCVDILKKSQVPDEEICKGLLYEAYYRLMEFNFPSGASRSPILGSIAVAGVATFPRSKHLLNGLRFCPDLDQLMMRLTVAYPSCEMFLAACTLLDADGAVRALENALLFDRHAVAFWKKYLDLSKSAEEQVLLRALRSSPWCKYLWLRFYETCSSDDEKRDVYQLMLVKQIRIRQQLK
jgi:hypothetical protein